jgi:hypothetical protein
MVCRYNVLTDPTEHDDVSAQNPDVVARLTTRLAEVQATAFSPVRGAGDKKLGELPAVVAAAELEEARGTGFPPKLHCIEMSITLMLREIHRAALLLYAAQVVKLL